MIYSQNTLPVHINVLQALCIYISKKYTNKNCGEQYFILVQVCLPGSKKFDETPNIDDSYINDYDTDSQSFQFLPIHGIGSFELHHHVVVNTIGRLKNLTCITFNFKNKNESHFSAL